MNGRKIIGINHEKIQTDFKTEIDLQAYSEGVYQIKLTTGNRQYYLKAVKF